MNGDISQSNIVALKPGILQKLQVGEMVLVLALSVLIPFLIHLIPSYNGIPVGAIYLAMFIAPFIAVKFFKFHVALIVAASAPVLNFLITGNPVQGLVPLITFELIVFISISKILNEIPKLNYLNSLIAYLGTVLISLILINLFNGVFTKSAAEFISVSVFSAVPGIILLVLMNILAVKWKKSRN